MSAQSERVISLFIDGSDRPIKMIFQEPVTLGRLKSILPNGRIYHYIVDTVDEEGSCQVCLVDDEELIEFNEDGKVNLSLISMNADVPCPKKVEYQDGSSIAELVASLKEILGFMRKMSAENNSVSFSKVSEEKVDDLLRHYKLVHIIARRDDFIPDTDFARYSNIDQQLKTVPPMHWGLNEESSTPDALSHINKSLIACGASMYSEVLEKGSLNNTRSVFYKLVNICEQHNISLATSSTKYKGGVDGVIVPMSVASLHLQLRVSIELKHPTQVDDEPKWQQALNQSLVQLVAANAVSFHPSVHFLSDLKTRFDIFKISENRVLQYPCSDASTAFKILAYWLSCCSPEDDFIYTECKPLDPNLTPLIKAMQKIQHKNRSGDFVDQLKLDILDDLDPDERASYLMQTLMGSIDCLLQLKELGRDLNWGSSEIHVNEKDLASS